MRDVLIIADAILRIAKDQGKSLTPMQLVKLAYISQGFSLGLRGKPLFSNRIEAWQYGPVIPDLYHATKDHGRNKIPHKLIRDLDGIASTISDDELHLLEWVMRQYGHLTGVTLSYLTHRTGSPWSQVYHEGQRHLEIPSHLISEHYKKLVEALSDDPGKCAR